MATTTSYVRVSAATTHVYTVTATVYGGETTVFIEAPEGDFVAEPGGVVSYRGPGGFAPSGSSSYSAPAGSASAGNGNANGAGFEQSSSTAIQTAAAPSPTTVESAANGDGQGGAVASPTNGQSSTSATSESTPFPSAWEHIPDADFCSRPGVQNRMSGGIEQQWLCGAFFEGQSRPGPAKRQTQTISGCSSECWQDNDCVAAGFRNGTCQRFSKIDSYSLANDTSSTALLYTDRAKTTFQSLGSSVCKASGKDTGVIAGAAVGAGIGGILLGLAAMFFFMRGKKRRAPRQSAFVNEKAIRDHPWDVYLPQSADDQTISRSVQSLFSQIDLHVENYYSNKATAGVSETVQESLAKVNSGELPSHVKVMLVETTTPLPIIKHSFAWFILSKLSPCVSGEGSLLPAEFARLPPKLAGSGVSNKSGARAREDYSTPEAYNYWRVLTAHLMHARSASGPSRTGVAASSMGDCATTLSVAFAPWAKTAGDETSAQEHLLSVLKSASETGLLIMSQPSSFAFEWDTLAGTANGTSPAGNDVVVLPAFEKTADEWANDLPHRQVLVKPKTEPIAGRL